MSCGNYSYIFLDACFINRLKQVDNSCGLIDFFAICANAKCVIKMNQYREAPCNDYKADCKDLDLLLSDEDALDFQQSAESVTIDFSIISRDPNDVKIFLWGLLTKNSAIWTCDRNLLKLCSENQVERCCFKAAIKLLDLYLNGAIFNNSDINTELMLNGDDPFFHYNTNGRCNSHCKQTSTCICHNN